MDKEVIDMQRCVAGERRHVQVNVRRVTRSHSGCNGNGSTCRCEAKVAKMGRGDRCRARVEATEKPRGTWKQFMRSDQGGASDNKDAHSLFIFSTTFALPFSLSFNLLIDSSIVRRSSSAFLARFKVCPRSSLSSV